MRYLIIVMIMSIMNCSSGKDYKNNTIQSIYISNSDGTLLSDYVYLNKGQSMRLKLFDNFNNQITNNIIWISSNPNLVSINFFLRGDTSASCNQADRLICIQDINSN